MMIGENDNSTHRLFGGRRLGIAALAFATAALGVFVYVRVPGPSAIVSAPNRGERSLDRLKSDPSILRGKGIHERFRIEVGPPEASLGVWVMEPVNGTVDGAGEASVEARGTVLVLHGIRDDKRSMGGLGRGFCEAGFRCSHLYRQKHTLPGKSMRKLTVRTAQKKAPRRNRCRGAWCVDQC